MCEEILNVKLKILQELHELGVGQCSPSSCDDYFTFRDTLNINIIELLDMLYYYSNEGSKLNEKN